MFLILPRERHGDLKEIKMKYKTYEKKDISTSEQTTLIARSKFFGSS